MTQDLTPRPFLSPILSKVKGSPMLALVAKTAELRAQGRDLISLAAGEPDFATPDHIRAAAIEAMNKGDTRYTAVEGTIQLREAIIRKFGRENDLRFSLKEVIVGSGAKQVIFNALMATVTDGDEVIIPMPAYPTYAEITALCGGTPVFVSCPASQNFKLTAEQLERAITSRTKWLILCTPSNPTGATYSADELKALATVLERHPQVWVLSDDIYEHLLFTGQPFSTMAAISPTMRERTMTVNGVSKAYCMTGWRIGYGAGPEPLVRAMSTLQSQVTSNPCSISQAASIAALDGPQDFLVGHRDTYRARRDLVVSKLNETALVQCGTPDGAFYALASCEQAIGKRTPAGKQITSDADFAEYVMEAGNVVVVPGSVFGATNFFRLSYAADTQVLAQACKRIGQATAQLA